MFRDYCLGSRLTLIKGLIWELVKCIITVASRGATIYLQNLRARATAVVTEQTLTTYWLSLLQDFEDCLHYEAQHLAGLPSPWSTAVQSHASAFMSVPHSADPSQQLTDPELWQRDRLMARIPHKRSSASGGQPPISSSKDRSLTSNSPAHDRLMPRGVSPSLQDVPELLSMSKSKSGNTDKDYSRIVVEGSDERAARRLRGSKKDNISRQDHGDYQIRSDGRFKKASKHHVPSDSSSSSSESDSDDEQHAIGTKSLNMRARDDHFQLRDSGYNSAGSRNFNEKRQYISREQRSADYPSSRYYRPDASDSDSEAYSSRKVREYNPDVNDNGHYLTREQYESRVNHDSRRSQKSGRSTNFRDSDQRHKVMSGSVSSRDLRQSGG